MKRLELEVSKRDITGKKVRFLRRQGIVPANIYGHGIDSTAINVDAKSLKHLLAHVGRTDLISLKIGDSKNPLRVLVREVQKNPLTDDLLHVDFYQVRMDEKIKTHVPLVFVGEAPVLKKVKNSSLLHLIDSLHIEALPDDLPHSLEVDVSHLEEINQTIHIKDIPIGHGITLFSDPEQMVVKVVEVKKEVEVVPVEAAVAEEVEVAEGAEEAAAGPGEEE
ncbi:MAG: 50S ribosomal protein L25 [Chloroflexi bacterium]|jgi:large subunit ribosomal protein L25|nr:50S ribosomal protein L25 [Chloroflexota bacterium]